MDEQLIESLRVEIDSVLPGAQRLRRLLHSQPELGTDAPQTAELVRSRLSKESIAVRAPLLGSDVIAELDAGAERTVCLRADMDAVPIQEETGLPYASQVDGLMHACGHDGHMAMLLAAASVLSKLRDRLSVNVRLIFQPGEEMVCAGKELVARGACEGCFSAYAIHAWPGLPVGTVSTREGVLFAAGAGFEIRVRGKGCHGGMPETGINPITAAAAIVRRLQQYHESANRRNGTVISVCSLQAGESANVIPDEAIVRGTARHFRPSSGPWAEDRVRHAARKAAERTGARAEVRYFRDYDLPVINTRHGFEHVRDLATAHLGDGAWIEAAKPATTMDDFACYLDGREGAMLLLGMGEDAPNLHSPRFDFNDQALRPGILMLCLIALAER